MTEWQLLCIQCRQCFIFVYKWPHLFIVIHVVCVSWLLKTVLLSLQTPFVYAPGGVQGQRLKYRSNNLCITALVLGSSNLYDVLKYAAAPSRQEWSLRASAAPQTSVYFAMIDDRLTALRPAPPRPPRGLDAR